MAYSKNEMKEIKTPSLWLGLVFSYCLWYVVFVAQPGDFWLSLANAALLLGCYGWYFGGAPLRLGQFTAREVGIGLVGFAVLYVIFMVGNILSALLYLILPGAVANLFDPRLVGSVYGLGQEGTPWVKGLLLFFIISPCEEIFWRGFVQRWAAKRLGGFAGWLLAAFFYAGAHFVTGNILLVLAASVTGLFLGLLYWWRRNLAACIVAHALWTATIFLILPMPLFVP